MKMLKTIRDSDLGFVFPEPDVYEERRASRAVVFDSAKNTALLHATKVHYHKLPGGGIENGETTIDALRREVLEEIGCSIGEIRELGMIEEFKNKFALHQISYCFVAHLVGEKGTPQLEEDEIAEGFVTEWMSLDEAIKTLETEIKEVYQGKFIQMRDQLILNEAKKLLFN